MRRYHAPSPPLVRAALAALLVVGVLVACSGEAPLPGDPLRLASTALPDPVLGTPYRETIVAVGGVRPYDLRIDDGALPPGLALQGGQLLGTPTQLGEFGFVIVVSDGSLASTFQRFTLTVRDVPVPRVRIDVPPAEVRDTTTLTGRVENAAALRAMRVRLDWEDDAVTPAELTVLPSRNDVALFWTADEGGIAIDLAFLGDAFDGETDLFRIDLDVAAPTRLGLDLEVETLYADRRAYASERLGAPRTPSSDAGPTGAAPDDGPRDPAEDDVDEDDPADSTDEEGGA